MKTFVINLDSSIHNFKKQKYYLEKIGLNPIRFSGINALKNEHLSFKKYISLFALLFTPKAIIGCGLSHILLAELLNNLSEKEDYYLIMEDDVFPLVDKKTFNNELKELIANITIIDKNWDIIQLHSDALFPSHETYFCHWLSASGAAYLISRNAIKKMANEKFIHHIDIHTNIDTKYNKYKSRKNLFFTDEKTSMNRSNTKNCLIQYEEIILNKIFPLRGEKTWEILLKTKLINIPYLNQEISTDEFFNYLILSILLIKSVKFVNKIVLK